MWVRTLDFILVLNNCSEKILEGLKQKSEVIRFTFLKISLALLEKRPNGVRVKAEKQVGDCCK